MPRLIALLVVAAQGDPCMLARAKVGVTCAIVLDNERAATLLSTAGTRRPS